MNLNHNMKDEIVSFIYEFVENYQLENDTDFKEISSAYMPFYNRLYDRLTEREQRKLLEEIFSSYGKIYSIELMCAVLNGMTFYMDNRRTYTEEDGDILDLAIRDVILKNEKYSDLCKQADALQNELILTLNGEQRDIYDICRSKYMTFQNYSVGNSFRHTGEILMQLEKEFLGE